jgi:hypothetical protein
MFLEINTGSGCGNPMYNAGIANFQIYDNYDYNAGGAHPAANTFGFSAPFALATLNYGAAALPTGRHNVTATVVDAIGVLAATGGQSVFTTSGAGPAGPIAPNVDPGQQDFDIAGDAADPIDRRSGRSLTILGKLPK